jgi:hypothetical protein
MLHRLTGKTYSNGDTAISYFYDQTSYNGLAISNGVGRRTGISDEAGNRVVITDEQVLSGEVQVSLREDGVLSITTPQGTFTAVFFDPTPATVWVIPDPLPAGVAEALSQAGIAAEAGIKGGASFMAGNAALAGLGAGLGRVGRALPSLTNFRIFQGTKVVIDFVRHRIMEYRPGHIPPPGTMEQVRQAVTRA